MTHPTQHQLDQLFYIPDQLPAFGMEEIRTHVRRCHRCRTYSQFLQSFNVRLQQYSSGIPSARDEQEAEKIATARKRSSAIKPLYKVAAVIACLALTMIGYYLSPDEDQPRRDIAHREAPNEITSAAQTPPITESALVDNFTPSPHLDDLVQIEYRSIAVEVITPTINASVTLPVSFRWKEVGEPLLLKILTNKEKTIFSTQVNTTSYTMQKTLHPGLYYWKLETDVELLFVGKFVVKK